MLILMLRLLAVVPATLGALRLMWDAVLPASANLGHVGHSAGDNLMSLPWVSLSRPSEASAHMSLPGCVDRHVLL
jgi:hypothetical protein